MLTYADRIQVHEDRVAAFAAEGLVPYDGQVHTVPHILLTIALILIAGLMAYSFPQSQYHYLHSHFQYPYSYSLA